MIDQLKQLLRRNHIQFKVKENMIVLNGRHSIEQYLLASEVQSFVKGNEKRFLFSGECQETRTGEHINLVLKIQENNLSTIKI